MESHQVVSPVKAILFSFAAFVILLSTTAFAADNKSAAAAKPDSGPGKIPKRIVSLAPTITETLFAIGLDKEIVGDTKFCNYPPKAKTKRRVGGLIDLNFETILDLHPDLVIAMPSHGGDLLVFVFAYPDNRKASGMPLLGVLLARLPT